MNEALQAAYNIKYAPKEKKQEAIAAWCEAVRRALRG